MQKTTLSILVPLYNEEEFILTLLKRVVDAPLPPGMEREIIVVDDGSKDGSADLVEHFIPTQSQKILLVRHERNQGKGAAIRTAIQYATGDFALIQDSDLEYDPRQYPKLLGPLLAGDA